MRKPRISFSLRPDLYKKFSVLAKQDDRSVSNLACYLAIEYVKKMEKKYGPIEAKE